MALLINQELFGKKSELQKMQGKRVEIEKTIETLKIDIGEIDRVLPALSQEVSQLVARATQDLVNRVARINAACFRNDPFKYIAKLQKDLSITIEKQVSENEFTTVWGICQTASGEFGIDPEQNHLPVDPSEQLHLFGKFANIIANLK